MKAQGVGQSKERDDADRDKRNMEAVEREDALGAWIDEGCEPQDNGAKRDAHAHRHLLNHVEKDVGAAHPILGDIGEGQCVERRELHGAGQTADEQEGRDDRDWRRGREKRAGEYRRCVQKTVDDERVAKAEAAQDRRRKRLHHEIAGEYREDEQPRLQRR